MRHRKRGRKLGRNASHRKAMFRNMACSLIKSMNADPEEEGAPKVPGRIVTTVAKAKELRPFVEKLVTMARRAQPHFERAREYGTNAERNSSDWKSWRESDRWNEWAQAIAPAVALQRRAFAELRDNEAVSVLFETLGPRFADRSGGYTRVVRLATVRLGDAGQQALIEFVGDERDRRKARRVSPAPVVAEPESTPAAGAESASTESTPETAAAEPPASEESETEKS